VSFNDNDGGVSFFANPESAGDIARHYRIFGKWRARWIFFKRFWKALVWMEWYASNHGDHEMDKVKPWVFKASIPE
jgi:hypothetical protein